MSKHSKRIHEIMHGLSSKRITERKKYIKDLLEIYEDRTLIDEIDKNSNENIRGSVQWPDLFLSLHAGLILDAQRNDGKNHPNNKASIAFENNSRLMLETIRFANKKTLNLKQQHISTVILEVLSSDKLIYYHKVYMEILVKHFLSIRAYRIKISQDGWKELLELCMKLYNFTFAPNKCTVLQAIQIIISYGCLQSRLLLEVKSMLPFLEKIIVEVNANQQILAIPFCKLTYVLCQQIATESRVAICKFIKSTLFTTLALDRSKEKYDLLFLIIQIYSMGRSHTLIESSIFTNEFHLVILQKMYDLIITDWKSDNLPDSFTGFSSEVFKEIFETPDCAIDAIIHKGQIYTQPLKKNRVVIKYKSLHDIIMNINYSGYECIMTKILQVLIEKYPKYLTQDDYIVLLKFICELLSIFLEQEILIDNLYKLAATIICSETAIIDSTENIESYWNKIWDNAIRSITVNKNYYSAHKLIQRMLKSDKKLNYNNLLKLYVSNTIKWSSNSLHTLLIILQYKSVQFQDSLEFDLNSDLPHGCDSLNEYLLHWILNMNWLQMTNKNVFLDLCEIFTILITKSKNEKIKKDEYMSLCNCGEISCIQLQEYVTDDTTLFMKNLQNYYLSLTLNMNLCVVEKNEDKMLNYNFSYNPCGKTISLSVFLLNNIIRSLEHKDVFTTIMKIVVVVKLLSIIKELKGEEFFIENSGIISELNTQIQKGYQALENLLSKKKCDNLNNITKTLMMLYETNYSTEMTKLFLSVTSKNIILHLYVLSKIENDVIEIQVDETSSSFHDKRKFNEKRGCKFATNENNMIQTQIIITLTLFCHLYTEKQKNEVQNTVLIKLCDKEIYNSLSFDSFKVAMVVLISFKNQDAEIVHQNHSDMPINFYKNIFHEFYEDERAVRCMLKIFPYFFSYAVKYDYAQKLIDVCFIIEKQFCDGKYGPLTYVEYIKCLTVIIDNERNNSCDSSFKKNLELVISCVVQQANNPFYIVRLQMVQFFKQIFRSRFIALKLKSTIYSKLKDIINEMFKIPLISEDILADERETRIISSLLFLASAICNNGTFQNDALYTVFHLFVEQKIELKIGTKLICSIAEQTNHASIVRDNLHYLLSMWYEAKTTLNDFPWVLTKCSSENEFIKSNYKVLISVYLRNLDFDKVLFICRHLNIEVEKTISSAIPYMLPWMLFEILKRDTGSPLFKINKLFKSVSMKRDEFKNIPELSIMMNEHLDAGLINLIENVHDDEYFANLLKINVDFSESSPPYYKQINIDEFLMSIKNIFGSDRHIHHILAVDRKDVLQKILLKLATNIYATNFVECKLRAFFQYIYFCSFIIQSIEKKDFDDIATYIIRDICYNLLHLIKGNLYKITEAACSYLNIFLRRILPLRATDFSECLNYCVTILVPLAQNGTINTALEILEFLIIQQEHSLSNFIAKLNSFPNNSIFKNIRNVHSSIKYKNGKKFDLKMEIEHFINATKMNDTNCNVETLINLQYFLKSKKFELKNLINEIDILNCENNLKLSIFHQLIHQLIQLTETSDTKILIAVAQCLGELGPINLKSITFYPLKRYTKEDMQPMLLIIYDSLTLLSQFLINTKIDLRIASADALHNIFKYSLINEFLRSDELRYLQKNNSSARILNKKYLQPFLKFENLYANEPLKIDYNHFAKFTCLDNSLWALIPNDSYSEWIINMTCSLVQCFRQCFLNYLEPIFRLNVEICEILLPKIIFLTIQTDKMTRKRICKCMNYFFENYFNYVIQLEKTSNKENKCCRRAVHCMLDITNFIRIQDDNDLNFNYMYIAKSAHYCSAFFSALFYVELGFAQLSQESYDFSNIPKIDCICENYPTEGKILQSILKDTYSKIGDPDAIHGCGLLHLLDPASKMQHYIHTHEWDKAMLAQDIELHSGSKSQVLKELMKSLQKSGFQYMLTNLLTKENIKMIGDIQYDCAWRLSKWDLYNDDHENYTVNEDVINYNYYYQHYKALKYLRENNQNGLKNAIHNARLGVIKNFRSISTESSKTMYKQLTKLKMLSEIDELHTAESKNYSSLLEKWQEHDIIYCDEFEYREPILMQRAVMFSIKESAIIDNNIKYVLARSYLNLAENAASHGDLNTAGKVLGILNHCEDIPFDIKCQFEYQKALLSWDRKEYDIGTYLLRRLTNNIIIEPKLRSKFLRVYGDWIAETKSENPQVIIANYYEKSINLISSTSDLMSEEHRILCINKVALAKYVDSQFQQIKTYMTSPLFESLKECMKYSLNTIATSSRVEDNDLRSALIFNQKQNANDIAELNNIEKEKNKYLILASQLYLDVLRDSDDHNLLIFRLIALWFDNFHHEDINKLLNDHIPNIPSYKLVPLIPQLAVHLSERNTRFSENIYEILKRCSIDHPHHTLPVLFALKNSYEDYKYGLKKHKPIKEEIRVTEAKKLLKVLRDSKLEPIVDEMDKLADSLLMLANLISENRRGNEFKIPKSQGILKIKNLQSLAIPTITMNIDRKADYTTKISIYRFGETYELVGGKSAPKKITCIGSDGIPRKQLLKGGDDLRQDAVMQQVFGVMNELLQTNKETSTSKLRIRTYKVVPLSQRSGILEWCNNTMPILATINGQDDSSGLRKKYYPKDYNLNMCLSKMKNVQNKSNNVKLKVFMECCQNIHQTFHLFFIEKYPSPDIWFECKSRYIRSVATNSMVGYILGLGDRHLNNILIDQSTAEVIHIDLGIAFEQGKVLPIPETVPFRLTREIEAPMGISGVEGTMKRCCEKTMTVLRDQRQIIITLLQVLQYDPLFTWNITPAKACSVQGGNTSVRALKEENSTTNTTAKRALLRIEQKLQGTEDGLPTTVAGQVKRLIQEARDPSNLCRLFIGWRSFL